MKANYAADQTLVTIAKGGGSRVLIHGGTVSLNLRQIVADSPSASDCPPIAKKLPASVASLKIVTSSQLGLVRKLAKALHALAVWLTILTRVLYALGDVPRPAGIGRSTLMWVGSSLVFAGLLVLLARKIGQGQLVSAITTDASIEHAANDAYSVATSLLVRSPVPRSHRHPVILSACSQDRRVGRSPLGASWRPTSASIRA